MIKVEIVGATAKIKSLEKFASAFLTEARDAAHTVLGQMRADVMNYPPPPPKSTYKRTYLFKQSWSLRIASRSSVVLDNNTPYGVYVMGNMTQGQSAHMTHWRLFYTVAGTYIGKAANAVNAQINISAKKAGL